MAHRLPTFEEVVTDEWLTNAIRDGSWDSEHGSDVSRLVEDIQAGFGGGTRCPPACQNMLAVDAMDHPEMRQAILEFLRKRFTNHILPVFIGEQTLELQRSMTVNADWLQGLDTGDATLGLYWGYPFDGGSSYWMDEADTKVHVFMTAEAELEDVDWVSTFRQRLDYVYGDEENEVRLKEGRRIRLLALDYDGQEMDVAGKTASTGLRRPRPAQQDEPQFTPLP